MQRTWASSDTFADVDMTPVDKDTTVVIPAEFGSVTLLIDGSRYFLSGSRSELLAAVVDAGYSITKEGTCSSHEWCSRDGSWLCRKCGSTK